MLFTISLAATAWLGASTLLLSRLREIFRQTNIANSLANRVTNANFARINFMEILGTPYELAT